MVFKGQFEVTGSHTDEWGLLSIFYTLAEIEDNNGLAVISLQQFTTNTVD